MKTLLTFVFVTLTISVFGQQADTVVTIPGGGGFQEFYEKYSGVLWTILGLTGLSAFFWYRMAKVRDALNVLIDAGQDNHVTEAEWQQIAAAFKKIWGKKE